MTQLKPTLRVRVAAGFAMLGVAVSLVLGSWLYLASRDLEQRLIDEALSAELEDYLARLSRNPQSLPPQTATIRGYVIRTGALDEEVPAVLRDLADGRHTRDIDGVSYRVAVREQRDNTLYMLHNRTQLSRREQRFALILIIGMTLTAVLSAAGGWWLAGRVIAPVRELAQRVRGHDPFDLISPSTEGLPKDEVGELAHTIERYLTRLRAFVERERAFVSNASHELRTPLAVIQGAVEVLGTDGRLDARTQERVARIARATRGMADLTTALLMLAREAPGQSGATTPCAVEDVLREAIELHRPLLRHKPVTLQTFVRAQPMLAVERPLLAIALGNLVRNACAYTEQGRVTVVLDESEVRVTDTGPGMPSDELRCLFDQGDCSRRRVRGAGIGLPLVKRIADRQGWRISVDSREGRGTSFLLEFVPAEVPDRA
jgi:signal transduction histidine kinase